MNLARRTIWTACALVAGAASFASLGWQQQPRGAVPATMPAMPLPAAPAFNAEVMASDLRAPWALKFLPDGRVMFTEREGRVRIIKDNRLLPDPAFTVSDIKLQLKMGLMGLALHPDFANNHYVYASECHGDAAHSYVRLVRYREENDRLVDPKALLDDIPCNYNHAGGRLLFGPDRKLYMTTGDAGQPVLTQRLDSLAGKILRLNEDGSAPEDNPFTHTPNARPEIWSYGHRNPQGLAFQPGTGLLFETEHGPNGGDEFNLIKPGANYGWPFVTHDRTATAIEAPLVQFTPAIAPADCVFYDGTMFPSLKGDWLIATLRGESIIRAHLDGTRVTSVERLVHSKFGRLREIAVAPNGAIWITTSEWDTNTDGHKWPGFDRVIRLTPGQGTVTQIDRPPTARDIPRPVGAANIYREDCISCHGDGSAGAINSNLFDGKWDLCDGSDAAMKTVIRDGQIARGMPGFAGALTDGEIDEMIAYIRQREREYRGK